jgi:hypothetical protein
MSFSSVSSLGIVYSVNLGMPRNDHFIPKKIKEAIPSLFRGIFFEQNSFANPNPKSTSSTHIQIILFF